MLTVASELANRLAKIDAATSLKKKLHYIYLAKPYINCKGKPEFWCWKNMLSGKET